MYGFFDPKMFMSYYSNLITIIIIYLSYNYYLFCVLNICQLIGVMPTTSCISSVSFVKGNLFFVT